MSTALVNPFFMLQASGSYAPDGQLREENESLRQVVAFQDARILALNADNQDLQRLLGLRGEVANLEQQIEERQG